MKIKIIIGAIIGSMIIHSCNIPHLITKKDTLQVPDHFSSTSNGTNTPLIHWKDFFKDPKLIALIDQALLHNQELNAYFDEINIAQYEIAAKRGEYLPSGRINIGAGLEKKSKYTPEGSLEHQLQIDHGKDNPEPLGDLAIGLQANWEVDIWKKLRNAKESQVNRYLATVEGKHFIMTQLVSEISEYYTELQFLDQELSTIETNINILNQALEVIKLQKLAARTNALPVKKFEAEKLKYESDAIKIRLRILNYENKINKLVGRFPQKIERSSLNEYPMISEQLLSTIPSEMLENRADIRQATYLLKAASLDILVAKANFYPTLDLVAGIGWKAFKPQFLFQPASILSNVAGELSAPLINRNAIKSVYLSANAKQIQTAYEYEKKVLDAYMEVINAMNGIQQLQKNVAVRAKQVKLLEESTIISKDLFNSSRADYMEVLLTQRDALEATIELLESQLEYQHAQIFLYKALGGGWK